MHASKLLDICEAMSGGSAMEGSNLMKRANWTYDDEGNMVIVNKDGSRDLVPTITELEEECDTVHESRAYPMNVRLAGGNLILTMAGGGEIPKLLQAYAGKYEFDTIGSEYLSVDTSNATMAKKKVGMFSSKVDLTFSDNAKSYETSNYNKLG